MNGKIWDFQLIWTEYQDRIFTSGEANNKLRAFDLLRWNYSVEDFHELIPSLNTVPKYIRDRVGWEGNSLSEPV